MRGYFVKAKSSRKKQMRCECCDAILTKLEESYVFTATGHAANTCTTCLDTMDLEYQPANIEDDDYVDVANVYEEEQPLYDDDELWEDS